CRHTFLGNGACNTVCNVEVCGYDLGDCGSETGADPFDEAAWVNVCQATTVGVGDVTCAPGCSWDTIGDGICQPNCNLVDCAFDAGDCGGLDRLPIVNITSSNSHSAIVLETPVPAIVLRISGALDKIATTGSGLRRAVITSAHEAIVVVFEKPFTTVLFIDSLNASTLSISTAVYGKRLARGLLLTSVEATIDGLNLASAEVIERTPSKAELLVPWLTPTESLSVSINSTDTGPIRALCTAGATDCDRSLLGLQIAVPIGAKPTSVCIQWNISSVCVVIDAAVAELKVTTPTALTQGYPSSARDCAWFRWCQRTYDTLNSRCARKGAQNDIPKKALIAHCTRRGSQQPDGPTSSSTTAAITTEICRVRLGLEKLPVVGGSRAPPHPLDFSDTFGDSLRRVNALFNDVFGKSAKARGVPSHMPHFIQKRLFRELKAHWAQEFNETSAHRFRHPRDMQFAFSYMHYVTNRRKLHPPTSVAEVFHSFVDVNHNGVIDDWELTTMASMLATPQQTSAQFTAVLRACTDGTAVSLDTLLTACPLLDHHLRHIPSGNVPPTTHVVTDTRVIFAMIKNKLSVMSLLRDLKLRSPKFICINDDMPATNPEVVVKRLQSLLHDRWGTPSSMELTMGETISYKALNDSVGAGKNVPVTKSENTSVTMCTKTATPGRPKGIHPDAAGGAPGKNLMASTASLMALENDINKHEEAEAEGVPVAPEVDTLSVDDSRLRFFRPSTRAATVDAELATLWPCQVALAMLSTAVLGAFVALKRHFGRRIRK
ncbi:N-acetylglucosamine-1-phosphotransferase subunits alpha/beta, partial [Achlya hypogyna]